MQCPSCGQKLPNDPIELSSPPPFKFDLVGLPAGVKFDPTDWELIEHLERKVSVSEATAEAEDDDQQHSNNKSNTLIDEFIPTIEGEDGICYTHPENLPGLTRDGVRKHFFHRTSKAYSTGTRKRRKITTRDHEQQKGEIRWHKTGKTRAVTADGRQKGCKKILVLYKNFGRHRKPEKTNWVMHQYHLGELDEEKEEELVVSKVFYQTQPRQKLVNKLDHLVHHQDPYNQMILQTNHLHDHHQQNQQQHGVSERTHASALEKLVIGCTSAGSGQETSKPHSETEWMKYSYWLHDNPDHHDH